MSEERYYINSLTGFPMDKPDAQCAQVEHSILDRCYAHRQVATFTGKNAWHRARSRCRTFNNSETLWERRHA